MRMLSVMNDESLTTEAERLGYEMNGQPEGVVEANLPRLFELLEQASTRDELVAVIDALGYAWDENASLSVLRFADHPDASVRLAVVQNGVHGLNGTEGETAVSVVLIRLTDDASGDVRNWATFGLGSILELDTPEVRDAFVRRLEDPHDETRGEALVGLARRGDERALAPTLGELEGDAVGVLAVQSAAFLGNDSLLSTLQELRSWWDVDPELIETATTRCDPTHADHQLTAEEVDAKLVLQNWRRDPAPE